MFSVLVDILSIPITSVGAVILLYIYILCVLIPCSSFKTMWLLREVIVDCSNQFILRWFRLHVFFSSIKIMCVFLPRVWVPLVSLVIFGSVQKFWYCREI